MTGLIVIGGGEHACVVIEAAQSVDRRVVGFLDDKKNALACSLDVEHLGTLADAPRYQDCEFALGIGAVNVTPFRADLIARLGPYIRWATLVHASACVSPTAVLGTGVVVLARAFVGTRARLGDHTLVYSNSVVEHDNVIGDYTMLAPGVVTGGGVKIGSRCFVGIRAAVRDHVTIGESTLVAMGAVVVGSVGSEQVAWGAPAQTRARGLGIPSKDAA